MVFTEVDVRVRVFLGAGSDGASLSKLGLL
jgi:hypothetical protein